MENLELFGVLLVIVGLVGFVVFLKAQRPSDHSSDDSPKEESNQVEI
ncbi:MAG TPA: hypothetical protein PKK23_09695 [Nitrospirales bacterium]|nr:hypothetical protein [Nitrospirales bacterium]